MQRRNEVMTLPFPPSSLSGHADGNRWAKSSVTKLWRSMAREAAQSISPVDWEGDIVVEVTFTPPNRRGDRVNFPNRCKPIFDGLADRLGVNDSRFLPVFKFNAPDGKGSLEVRVIL